MSSVAERVVRGLIHRGVVNETHVDLIENQNRATEFREMIDSFLPTGSVMSHAGRLDFGFQLRPHDKKLYFLKEPSLKDGKYGTDVYLADDDLVVYRRLENGETLTLTDEKIRGKRVDDETLEVLRAKVAKAVRPFGENPLSN